MKKQAKTRQVGGRELFHASELGAAAPRSTRGASGSETPRGYGKALDRLISKARRPVREGELFGPDPSEKARAPGYRFNFYGGIVR
ncbi:MAG TPA: hypothetical protein PLB91_00315 [Spirochaetales bacterium]|nr:hypothetical protein [Spirochaetales bacterium]HRY54556.1 hypothetical protein [Spirochaetia bacterium]